jgi:enterochelin esterase-like enzyme
MSLQFAFPRAVIAAALVLSLGSRSIALPAVSKAVKDENGFLVHAVESEFQKGQLGVRVLLPDMLEKKQRYPVVYVLPVETENESHFGDGLLEIKKRNLHNRYPAIYVAPTFSNIPWYADHPSDKSTRQESYLIRDMLPFIEREYPALTEARGRLLLGFSKSGWGAWSLLLRHPEIFAKAAAWDAPMMMDRSGPYGSGGIFGTTENFQKYQIAKLVENASDDLKKSNRLILLGVGNFRNDHEKIHALLERMKVPHGYTDGPARAHHWHSGWVEQAVAMLFAEEAKDAPLRVGAAAVEIAADDSMPLGGSILPGVAKGQEGQLRAVAVVIEKPGSGKVAIVACDVLFVTRDMIDPVAEQIAKDCGIPVENILINATHTHSAPSTGTVHGYKRDEIFCRNVQQSIVKAVRQADERRKSTASTFAFRLGEESSVGQNSRLLLKDNTIYWIGPRDEFVRPTGPFDPELPVLAFRDDKKKLQALIFNHSTHTIGARKPGFRSPSFYGLACQELETELGGTVCFLEGASGSTHNLTLKTDEMVIRMKQAVKDALDKAEPREVNRVAALKKKFTFKVRHFDEEKEELVVSAYCKKMAGANADSFTSVFRDQRKTLAPQQGQERSTWLQTIVIGDVAIVGVPAEFFTILGQEIKRRSPYRYTYVAELANDWIGYLPDKKAFDLGGYQTWTGLHSYAEPSTGERIVDEVVKMLKEMHSKK